jgi:hypothetical protein
MAKQTGRFGHFLGEHFKDIIIVAFLPWQFSLFVSGSTLRFFRRRFARSPPSWTRANCSERDLGSSGSVLFWVFIPFVKTLEAKSKSIAIRNVWSTPQSPKNLPG